mmetsp:Transcript_35440/g.69947  ORF Transcript_35440/g.69947 Transcript_35440/m.69947 type:complete len:208 (+) Transcript_35440:728-1351(+)
MGVFKSVLDGGAKSLRPSGVRGPRHGPICPVDYSRAKHSSTGSRSVSVRWHLRWRPTRESIVGRARAREGGVGAVAAEHDVSRRGVSRWPQCGGPRRPVFTISCRGAAWIGSPLSSRSGREPSGGREGGESERTAAESHSSGGGEGRRREKPNGGSRGRTVAVSFWVPSPFSPPAPLSIGWWRSRGLFGISRSPPRPRRLALPIPPI